MASHVTAGAVGVWGHTDEAITGLEHGAWQYLKIESTDVVLRADAQMKLCEIVLLHWLEMKHE